MYYAIQSSIFLQNIFYTYIYITSKIAAHTIETPPAPGSSHVPVRGLHVGKCRKKIQYIKKYLLFFNK